MANRQRAKKRSSAKQVAVAKPRPKASRDSSAKSKRASRSSGTVATAKKPKTRPVSTKASTVTAPVRSKATPGNNIRKDRRKVVSGSAAVEVARAAAAVDTSLTGEAAANATVRGSDAPVRKHSRVASSNGRKPSSEKKTKKIRRREYEEQPVRMQKSRLKPHEVEEYRRLLLEKRRQLIGDMGLLSEEATGTSRKDSAGDLSLMPNHMADLGSDNWEQEFTLGLLENERNLLREIDEALARIDAGTYGVCIATGKPISKVRLNAKPWARYCIEHARRRELGLVS